MKRTVAILVLLGGLLGINICQSVADPLPRATTDGYVEVQSGIVWEGPGSYEWNQPWGVLGVWYSLGTSPSVKTQVSITNYAGINDSYGRLGYSFRVYPKVPVMGLDLDVHYRLHYSGYVSSEGTSQLFSKAELRLAGLGPWGDDLYLFSLVAPSTGGYYETEGTYAGTLKIMSSQEVILVATSIIGMDPAAPVLGGLCKAVVDPTVEIDPSYTYNIGGVDYSGPDLFGVELSPNLVPIPGALCLFGSGLLGLVGWRRLRKG